MSQAKQTHSLDGSNDGNGVKTIDGTVGRVQAEPVLDKLYSPANDYATQQGDNE